MRTFWSLSGQFALECSGPGSTTKDAAPAPDTDTGPGMEADWRSPQAAGALVKGVARPSPPTVARMDEFVGAWLTDMTLLVSIGPNLYGTGSHMRSRKTHGGPALVLTPGPCPNRWGIGRMTHPAEIDV